MNRLEDNELSSVPAFLTKLWSLVEESAVDDLICWDPSGKSFHVYDQARFSKDILPLYFKHGNMSSFIRQLNMYGFKKVTGLDHGGLVKVEADDIEFQHMYFMRGREDLLGKIKRKSVGANVKGDEVKLKQEDVSKVLTDVRQISGRQERMTSKLANLQRENEMLWREMALLRQKHAKQQQIVSKLVQFLITVVGSNQRPLKRAMPMLEDSVKPKVTRFDEVQDQSYSVQPSTSSVTQPLKVTELATSGPIIEEVAGTPATTDDPLCLEPVLLDNPPHIGEPETIDLDDLVSEVEAGSAASLRTTEPSSSVAVMEQPSNLDSHGHTSCTAVGLPAKSKPNLSLDIGKANSNDVAEQLECLTADVDAFKDMLSGNQYYFDPNAILELFGPDSLLSMPDMPVPAKDTNEKDDSRVVGNELVEYRPIVFPDFSVLDTDSEALTNPLTGEAILPDSSNLVTPDIMESSEPPLDSSGLLEEVD